MNEQIIKTTAEAIDWIEQGMAAQDDVLAAHDFVRQLGEVHRELRARLEAATIAYIGKHGPIDDGTRKYWVAPNKTTKCNNVRETVEAVLGAVGGDVDSFASCLSSSAFKPAATMKVLGDDAPKHFTTTETADLKTKETGTPRLQVADKRFLNAGEANGEAE